MIARVLRWTVGLLFLGAGLAKVTSPSDFATALREYQLLPESVVHPLSYLLPWFEALLGISLLRGWLQRAALGLAGILSAAFATAITSALLRGLEVDCGCFSGGAAADIGHILLNFVMLGLCLHLYLLEDRPGPVQSPLPIWAFLTLLAVLSGSLVSVRQPVWMEKLLPPASFEEIQFEPQNLELGNLWQKEEVFREVSYRNVSRRTLTVLRSNSSCNCTTPELSALRLRPGDSGVLKVGYRAGTKTGPASSRVRLYLKGSPRPAILELTAQIEATASLEPEQLTLSPGQVAEVRLTIHRKIDPLPRLVVGSTEIPIDTEILPTSDGYLIKVQLAPLSDGRPAALTRMLLLPLRLETVPPLPMKLVIRQNYKQPSGL